jgi:integrase/recombinase XerD
MVIRVKQGKGNQDRYTLLSKTLLEDLRRYWLKYKPRTWLFPSNTLKDKPIHQGTVQKVFSSTLKKAKIYKPATVHTLRHSFATHLLEQGVSILTIQHLLGHAHLHTTLIYLHIQKYQGMKIINPLDNLEVEL